MAEDWGPWVAHDGAQVPVARGVRVQVEGELAKLWYLPSFRRAVAAAGVRLLRCDGRHYRINFSQSLVSLSRRIRIDKQYVH